MSTILLKLESMMTKNSKSLFYVFFFLSGLAGLIYEVVWGKYLSLFIGNTTYAHTVVLAAFMGGVSLGNVFIGRYSDRIKSILKLYAQLEIGIGLYCLLFLLLVPLFSSTYIFIAKLFQLNTMLVYILKFLFSTLLIIIPAFLMGGTMPVLVKYLAVHFAIKGRVISNLYFLNSLGAVAGGLVAGFFLVPFFGLIWSEIIAVILNVVIGLAVLFIYFAEKKSVNANPNKSDIEIENQVEPTRYYQSLENKIKWLLPLALAGIGLSGFCSFLFELLWIRLLSSVIGSSSYSFTIMLATFISGIALGSLIVHARVDSIKKPMHLFALLQIILGLVLVCVLLFYNRIPYIFTWISSKLTRDTGTYGFYQGGKVLLCMVLMIVPTTITGMMLPIITTFLSKSYRNLGRDVGRVFSINTAGCVIGAILTGLVFIPFLGTRLTFMLGITITILSGASIFSFFMTKKGAFMNLSLIIVLLSALFTLAGYHWDNSIKIGGNYLHGLAVNTYEEYRSHFDRFTILFFKEDSNTSVAVTEFTDERGSRIRTLRVNGKPDASNSYADIPTQLLIGHIPMLLNASPHKIALIGIGSGSTAGAILQHTPVERLDVVEISSAVVTAANRYFSSINYKYDQDPRTHVSIEDAKTFFRITPHTYDVIISEPSNPWISGIGALFTKEYFTEMKEHLNDGGIAAQWLQLYNISDETVQIVVNTYRSVFDSVTIWSMTGTDILLIGQKEGDLNPDFGIIEKRLKATGVQETLAMVHINTIETFLYRQILSSQSVESFQSTQLNKDLYPILEYRAPKEQYLSRHSTMISTMDERITNGEGLLIFRYMGTKQLSEDAMYNVLIYLLDWEKSNEPAINYFFNKTLPTVTDPGKLFSLIEALDEKENWSVIDLIYRRILIFSRKEHYLNKYAIFLLNWAAKSTYPGNKELYDRAITLFKECLTSQVIKDKYYFNISLSWLKQHDFAKARLYIDKTIEYRERHAGTELIKRSTLQDEKVLYQAAVIYFSLAKSNETDIETYAEKTEDLLKQLIEIKPDHKSALTMLEQLKELMTDIGN